MLNRIISFLQCFSFSASIPWPMAVDVGISWPSFAVDVALLINAGNLACACAGDLS